MEVLGCLCVKMSVFINKDFNIVGQYFLYQYIDSVWIGFMNFYTMVHHFLLNCYFNLFHLIYIIFIFRQEFTVLFNLHHLLFQFVLFNLYYFYFQTMVYYFFLISSKLFDFLLISSTQFIFIFLFITIIYLFLKKFLVSLCFNLNRTRNI